jgi:hypothetical protein
VKTIILLIVLMASATPALADECDGLLRRNEEGLLLLAPRGNEREGACVVAKTDEPRVLRDCKMGERCVVRGDVRVCSDAGIDSGECVEIRNVTRSDRK